MKVVTVHPNQLNEAMSCHMSIMPTPGMLGTYFVGSDRYEVVCAKVLSPKRVIVLDIHDPKKKIVDGIEYYDGDIEQFLKDNMPSLDKEYARAKKYGYSKEDAEADYVFNMKRFEHDSYFSLRKGGRWLHKGANRFSTGAVHFGHAERYLDPSF